MGYAINWLDFRNTGFHEPAVSVATFIPEEGKIERNLTTSLPARFLSEMAAPAADEAWCRETVPRVMELVSPRLPQRDVCALLAVSPWCYRALIANPRLWEVRIT